MNLTRHECGLVGFVMGIYIHTYAYTFFFWQQHSDSSSIFHHVRTGKTAIAKEGTVKRDAVAAFRGELVPSATRGHSIIFIVESFAVTVAS